MGVPAIASEQKGYIERFKDWGNEKPSTNFYIFGSLGSVNSTKSDIRKWADDNYPNKEENNSGGKFGVGYSLNKYFAIEGQIVTLADFKYSEKESYYLGYKGGYRFYDEYEDETTVESRGFGINLVGNTPSYKDFSLFGKVGYHMINTEYKTTYTYREIAKDNFAIGSNNTYVLSKEVLFKESKKMKSNIMTFAMGISYKIQEKWFATLEYERFAGLSKGDYFGMDSKFDASMTSLGIGFKF